MADGEVLKQLHDIHLPKAIGWWPLAFGWYFLIIATLSLLSILFWISYRRRIRGRAKREALLLLEHYQQQYLQDQNSQICSKRISELLRRVALVYFPREQVAGLQGKEWIDFLNSSGKGVHFDEISSYLLALPYQPASKVDLSPLFQFARRWIKQRGIPCSS